MSRINDFEDDVNKLDKELKRILDHQIIDKIEVQKLQTNLDKVSEVYSEFQNEEAFYKLLEIQAYIHFLNDNLQAAHKFVESAKEVRGRSYYEAEVLVKFIDDRKMYIKKVIIKTIKVKAKGEMIKGAIFFFIGFIITLLTYNHAGNQADLTGESQSYFVVWGPMLFGVIALIRGIALYINSFKKADEILDKV